MEKNRFGSQAPPNSLYVELLHHEYNSSHASLHSLITIFTHQYTYTCTIHSQVYKNPLKVFYNKKKWSGTK